MKNRCMRFGRRQRKGSRSRVLPCHRCSRRFLMTRTGVSARSWEVRADLVPPFADALSGFAEFSLVCTGRTEGRGHGCAARRRAVPVGGAGRSSGYPAGLFRETCKWIAAGSTDRSAFGGAGVHGTESMNRRGRSLRAPRRSESPGIRFLTGDRPEGNGWPVQLADAAHFWRMKRRPWISTSSGLGKRSRQTRVAAASAGRARPNASITSQPS